MAKTTSHPIFPSPNIHPLLILAGKAIKDDWSVTFLKEVAYDIFLDNNVIEGEED